MKNENTILFHSQSPIRKTQNKLFEKSKTNHSKKAKRPCFFPKIGA